MGENRVRVLHTAEVVEEKFLLVVCLIHKVHREPRAEDLVTVTNPSG